MSSLPSFSPPSIRRLSPRHKAILDLHLSGLSNLEIAGKLSITPVNVCYVLKTPMAQDELARRRGVLENKTDEVLAAETLTAAQVIRESEVDAAFTLQRLLENDSPHIQLQAAKDILDRSGFGKGSAAPVTILSAEKIQLLVTSLKEARELQGGLGFSECQTIQSPAEA